MLAAYGARIRGYFLCVPTMKTPRWVLIGEGVLLLAALLVVAYKAAMWVRPLGRVEQAQFLKKVDPAVRVQEYYSEYPESYIRVTKESWRYLHGTAHHNFTLTNQAAVTYEQIAVEFRYESAGGKTLLNRTVTLTDRLGPMASLQVSGLQIKNVPAESDRVVLRIVGARVAGRS